MESYNLTNGLRVLLVPMSGVQSTAIGVYVGTGTRYETPNINGISHFAEHMVFKGTKNYPTTRDTSSLEGLGAIQNAWTDSYATAYWCKIPGDSWQKGLDLVKDLALYPKFPEAELEVERGVILEEINRYEDQPDDRVGDVLMQAMFSPNPLGMRILGQPEVIKKLTRQDFVDYHTKFYKSGSMLVVIAGKIIPEEAKKEIENHFGALAAENPQAFEPYVENQTGPQISIYPKDTAEQVHIELAVRGLASNDPRRYALTILNSILGSGMSSRLFIEVREKLGLCYSISSEPAAYKDTGLWSVHAGLNTNKLPEAITTILGEMKKMTTELVSEKELEQAKSKIKGHLIFAQENPINQMEYYAHQALVRDELIDYETLLNRLMQITVQDVQQVAKDLFKTEKLTLAIVGPLKEEEKADLVKLLVI